MGYQPNDIRNVAFIGHAGCGKTSLIEQLLFKTKMTSRCGSVNEGTSILDVGDDEKARKSTIDSAVAYLDHEGMHVNMIDTPGLLDFVTDAIGALAAVEAAAVCVDAKAGPKVATRKLWRVAGESNLPRALIVTRLDQQDCSFEDVVSDIKNTFGDKCCPLFIPNDSGPGFSSLESALTIREGSSDNARAANEVLTDAVVETDEALMERYLEGEAISRDELFEAMKKAFIMGEIYPILPLSADKDLGLAQLLEVMKLVFPSPLDLPHDIVDGDETKKHDPNHSDFTGKVFKSVQSESGKLSFARVMSGALKSGDQLNNLSQDKSERGAHLFKVQGKDRQACELGVTGDIVAIPKADSLQIGDTLGPSQFKGRYVAAKFPRPMVGKAIVPKSRGDASKLLDGLRRLHQEAPTFQFEKHPVTHDLVVRGNSLTHLQVMLERLKTRSKIEVEQSDPKIPYRETITTKGDSQYRHRKQSGGSGEFGEVWMRIEPKERDSGFEFVSEIVGGSIDKSYFPSIEKGVKDVMTTGIIAGCRIVDVKVIIYDGKQHAVDSKDVAFQKAGKGAFRESFQKARPIMLEPIVALEVNVPSDYVGDVNSDISGGRRGQIVGTDYEGNYATVKATVPLSELTGYDAQLRSMTAGEGSYILEPSHYDVLPSNIQQQLQANHKSSKSD
jgi:elongation factor G